MHQVYDTNIDHLKCSFCTQYFVCSQHYANLQRYSLKACAKCIEKFNYTLLHPTHYKIYRVLLLDTNVQMMRPQEMEGLNQLKGELEQAEQEVKASVSRHFEEKIEKLLKEMEEGNQKVTERADQLRKQLKENRLDEKQQEKHEWLQKVNTMKERPLTFWLKNKTDQLFPPPLAKTKSTHLLSSRKSSCCNLEKENNVNKNNIKPGWGKAIKYRVGIRNKQNKHSMKSSVCLDQPRKEPLREQSPSLNNSFMHTKSAKRLGMSVLIPHVTPLNEERDLAEVTRMLEAAKKHNTYLPLQLQPDNSVIIKNQSKRTQADSIIDIRERTIRGGQLLELIGSDVSKVNFECFLKSLGDQPQTKIVRIIKTGMTDYEFDGLLRFLARHPSIETVIVTNNKLTELSLAALQTFKLMHKESSLSQIYLGSNKLHRQHCSGLVQGLSKRGLAVYL